MGIVILSTVISNLKTLIFSAFDGKKKMYKSLNYAGNIDYKSKN